MEDTEATSTVENVVSQPDEKLLRFIYQLEQEQYDVSKATDLFKTALNAHLEEIISFYKDKEATLAICFDDPDHPQEDLADLEKATPLPRQGWTTRDDLTAYMHTLNERQLHVALLDLDAFVSAHRASLDKLLCLFDIVFPTASLYTDYQPTIASAYPFLPAPTARRLRWISHVHNKKKDSAIVTVSALAVALQPLSHHQDKECQVQINTTSYSPSKLSSRSPTSRFTPPAWLTTLAAHVQPFLCLAFCLIVFAILLNLDLFHHREENYCFALLLLAALLWATEAIPLFATSLMLPFLIVLLGSMFSSTIVMLLSGFALATAFQKYGLARAFAVHILSRVGSRPATVLLTIMLIAAFLSMWISNVATPVLCYSLIQPLLQQQRLPCFVLGIALASSLAGMLTPISSPQNIITLGYMPGFGWGWLAVSLPVSLISILFCWLLLLVVYRPQGRLPPLTLDPDEKIPTTPASQRWQQTTVLLVTLITVLLWCTETMMHQFIGGAGVIACIPLFVLFGSGLLNKDDLQHEFLWPVVVLAQGGMALGEAVAASGLLQDIALHIKDMVVAMPLMAILSVFSMLILVFATFVSHTVAALIIIPIVQQVGQQLPEPHPNLLVMGAGLACSTACALSISGYPNMVGANLEDKHGRPYLTSKDFLIVGIPTSLFSTLLVVTMGYAIMVTFGF
ncbi:hypothetical protein DM01DRAFT_1335534 [Hesseltinella vesiculosa]|uniref:Citrate transporter-like domain-containing protein n=1 Tax=Hesseltinella vesiculosa TaxID=101127 RepID=A0A1X2GJC9_9FUNG|nr:hypothetical protein DM01DRAFT_1335534 [Hesseltinella vesiculosa]